MYKLTASLDCFYGEVVRYYATKEDAVEAARLLIAFSILSAELETEAEREEETNHVLGELLEDGYANHFSTGLVLSRVE